MDERDDDEAETNEVAPTPEPEEEGSDAPVIRSIASTSRREPAPRERMKSILESLLFVSDRPVTARELGRAIKTEEKKVQETLEQIRGELEGRGLVLAEVAGGYQLRSSPDNATWVQAYLQARPVRLSRAALETLAIIAYRQPLTRPEVDDLRGVDCGGVMKLLLERGLVRILGKKDEPGRPLLYGTTAAFLELFGLRSLRDLPTLRQFTELTEEHRALVDRETGAADLDGQAPEPRDTEPQPAGIGAEEDPDDADYDPDLQEDEP
ncbi:MAG: SMC-Scp complex subunit ScpB [Deltaproteobacteria bacterium]|nr:SMC-Scp complex subunit ScpB [Deltaproteobacteria bacterium]